MIKKLSLLFFICILSALSINAEVYTGSCGSNVKYSLETSTGLLSITGTGAMKNYGSYSSVPWYSNKEYIKVVEISDGVTSIGKYAFEGCSGLTSVTIPNSVTSIGSYAFDGCSSLTKVTLNSNAIASKSYSSSSTLGSIFGSQVNEYVLGDDVTSIGSYVFYNCSKLTSVTIGNSVTSIGERAFYYCSSLTSVTIPNSVTSIGERAFQSCSGLKEVKSEILVPFTFGSYAFSGISSNCVLAVPSGTKDAYIAKGWTQSVFKGGIKEFFPIVDGIYYYFNSNNKQATVTAGENKYSGNVIIPSSVTFNDTEYSVTSIGDYAFSGCSGLTSITIGNSVTRIGSSAFQNCSGLTSITIPNSVTSIEDYAFYKCSKLTSVTIGNSVTSIGDYAFNSCSGLTSVTIPNSVTSIGNSAFKGCYRLTSITIPNSVTSIGSSAFYGCSGLTSVTIPNSVTSIGSSAFYDCSGLTSVTIPNSVTSIGSSAFWSCSGLTSVTIPNSVTSIGENAFYRCSGLTQVTLNSNDIVSKSYSSSSTLGSIFGSQVKEYILGDDVTSIGSYAFYDCSNVTSITIADNVTSVGYYAFDGTAWYNNLPDGLFYAGKIAYKYQGTMPENTSMIIKEGTVELNDNLFDGCTGLTSVYIPSSIKTIGNNAFAKCTELLDVYCYARKSPAMGTNAFANSGIQFATLYVPEASLNGYKVTGPWSGFGDIKALSGEYPEVPEITKCATPTIIFENGKLSFSCETEGVKYVYNFSTPSESDEDGKGINTPNKLQVSVYAKKDGYENSDVATKEIDLGTSGLRGDVNNDGTVSMPDAMFIVNKILNGKFPDE